MQDFRPLWKELHKNRKLTFRDCIQRCILVGMHQGKDFEEKCNRALALIDRAFSSDNLGRYDKLKRELRWAARSNFGIADKIEMSDEEKELFERIGSYLQTPEAQGHLGKHYSYIFLFGKLIPEQATVQTAHAAMQLGSALTMDKSWPRGVNSRNLHYVLVDGNPYGGPAEIAKTLAANCHGFLTYRDHDYWFDANGNLCESPERSIKSIMTYPIPWWKRRGLQEMELLRFESDGSNQRDI